MAGDEGLRSTDAQVSWARQVLQLLPSLLDREQAGAAYRGVAAHLKQGSATCPCCGYRGRFESFGPENSPATRCPQCASLPRQRLLALAVREGAVSFAGQDVLHFAPEPTMARIIKGADPKSYRTADITPGRADEVLNLHALDKPEGSFDRVVASHVLEHVDDALAMPELYRILRPGGALIAMVPVIDGWQQTYEDAAIVSERARALHFGQHDHVRYYGADFAGRLASHGFVVREFVALGRPAVEYALSRGEKVYIAVK